MRYFIFLLAAVAAANASEFDDQIAKMERVIMTPPPVHREGAGGRATSAVPKKTRVTDAATWQALIKRAETRPTRTQTTRIGSTTYRISIVSSKNPVNGQDCPAGTTPQNTLFVARATEGTGKDIYPVRFSVVCAGDAGTRDSFSLAADWDGNILDAAVYNGSLGLVVHPTAEPETPTTTEPTSLDLFLARLIKQFLDL